MTAAAPFLVERIDLRDPDGNARPEVWECGSAEEAAVRFDSEGGSADWLIEEAMAALDAGAWIGCQDRDAGFHVIARRVR